MKPVLFNSSAVGKHIHLYVTYVDLCVDLCVDILTGKLALELAKNPSIAPKGACSSANEYMCFYGFKHAKCALLSRAFVCPTQYSS